MTDTRAIAKLHDRQVGAKLAGLRRQNSRSAKEISDAIGIPVGEYDLLESGAVRAKSRQLYELSKYYDVSIAYFFEGIFRLEASPNRLEIADRASAG